MRARTAALALAASALLTSCAGQPEETIAVLHEGARADALHGTEITDVIGRPALVLQDTDGKTFDLRDRPAEELTAVFFGYTRCPDVCPSTMADLAAAFRQLDQAQREDVEVVFVTEDPDTDTAPVLRRYLDGFDRSFTGLVGGNSTTERALDALKATPTEIGSRPTASATPVPTPGTHTPGPHTHTPGTHTPGTHTHGTHTTGAGETIEHGGSVYVFRGDRAVVYTGGTTPAQYAEDFRTLLS